MTPAGDLARAGEGARPEYSIVVPVYNGAATVGRVIERTARFFERQGHSAEIILVNDGSRDASWEVVSREARERPGVIAIDLLRNYGQHSAVYCGLEHSRGAYVVTLDDDLQNPPEEIEHLIEAARRGHDVVFGRFAQKRHSLVRRAGSHVVRLLNKRIFSCPAGVVPTNFRLVRRDVVERILRYQTAYPYITGLVLMFAGNPANVTVEHHERGEGRSNYNAARLLSLVARILFNYSLWPLRAVSAIGIIVSLLSFLAGAALIVNKLLDRVQVEGWTGLMVMLSFFNGVVILMLGMLGEYTARILQQLSSREICQVREVVRRAE